MEGTGDAPIDESTLEELRDMGGDAMVRDLVDTFVAQIQQHRVELAAAEAAGDLRALVVIAHTIAGSSAALGGREVARAAREIEHLALEGGEPTVAFAKVHLLAKRLEELTSALTARVVS